MGGGQLPEAPAAEEMLDHVVCSRCALKVVMVAELFVTGDREFQTDGAMTLNAWIGN